MSSPTGTTPQVTNRIEELGVDYIRGLADDAIYRPEAWDQRSMLYRGLPPALNPAEMSSIGRMVSELTLLDGPIVESPEFKARRAVKFLGRAAFARGDQGTHESAIRVLREEHGLLGRLAAFHLVREARKL